MLCSDIMKICEELAPRAYACDWDNPGLLAGRSDKEVSKILLAVDATDAVIREAEERGADMIITHHPLIFRGIRSVSDLDFVGRRIMRMIRRDISCYAMHTNFDAAPGCMGDLAAEALGLSGTSVLDPMGETADGRTYGIGVVGSLAAPVTLAHLAEQVKEAFRIPGVRIFGDVDSGQMLSRAAICPGSGGSEIGAALRSGAGVYITGDISHHEGIDAVEQGMAVIDAGHYGIEHIFMPAMERYLVKRLAETGEGGAVRVMCAAEHFPDVIL